MSIKKYEGQELKVGQYLNFETILTYDFASSPYKIVEVKGKSVVVCQHRKTKDGDEFGLDQLKHNTSIRFVCDTFEESEKMHQESRKHRDDEHSRERQLNMQRIERRRKLIEKLISE